MKLNLTSFLTGAPRSHGDSMSPHRLAYVYVKKKNLRQLSSCQAS